MEGVSPIYQGELSELVVWTEAVHSRSGFQLDSDTLNIALQLLHRCKLERAADLELYYIGCIYIALKYYENEDIQLSADSFLSLFNPHRSHRCPLSTSQLFQLEKDILTRTEYYIPTATDPVILLTTMGVKKAVQLCIVAQVRILKNLAIFQDHRISNPDNFIVSNFRLISIQLLFACRPEPCSCHPKSDSLLQPIVKKSYRMLQHLLQPPSYLDLDPFMRRLCILYQQCMTYFITDRYQRGCRLLQATLTFSSSRQVNLSHTNPLREVLYYSSLSSWLRQTKPAQRKRMLKRLAVFDQQVKSQNPSPSVVVSRTLLLALFFVVSGELPMPRLHLVYTGVEDVVRLKHWYNLGHQWRPDVLSILNLLMTPLTKYRQRKKDILAELRTYMYTIIMDSNVDLLKSGCY